jgi:curved DNA-binding protein CbpA
MNELHKAYAVLGLEPGSSMDSIMRRYKRLIMVWHPDRAPSPDHKEFAEEELKKINNAKDVLTKHFGANGGHRATGCDCQPGAGAAASAGSRSSSGGTGGPGPNYHRSKTADDKYQEEQAAKKRDAERRAREEAEANAKRQQEQYKQQSTQQSMESAMQQQAALRDEKLRWQISIGLIIAFVALEIFGTMTIGAKTWWKDMTWKWQNQHQHQYRNFNRYIHSALLSNAWRQSGNLATRAGSA